MEGSCRPAKSDSVRQGKPYEPCRLPSFPNSDDTRRRPGNKGISSREGGLADRDRRPRSRQKPFVEQADVFQHMPAIESGARTREQDFFGAFVLSGVLFEPPSTPG